MFASWELVQEEVFIAKRVCGADIKRGGKEGGDSGEGSSGDNSGHSQASLHIIKVFDWV